MLSGGVACPNEDARSGPDKVEKGRAGTCPLVMGKSGTTCGSCQQVTGKKWHNVRELPAGYGEIRYNVREMLSFWLNPVYSAPGTIRIPAG